MRAVRGPSWRRSRPSRLPVQAFAHRGAAVPLVPCFCAANCLPCSSDRRLGSYMVSGMSSYHNEMWKQAPGCVGIEVSTLGRVRNRWGRILRGSVEENGYHRVKVRVGGVGEYRNKYVHRLVLEAFVGPCPPGMEARHLSGDPGGNRLENLEWGTPSENNRDILRHGRHVNANRTHCPRRHPLVGANLVPSHRRRGWRSCLACDRARNYGRRRGWSVGSAEFTGVADSYFAALGLEVEGERRAA